MHIHTHTSTLHLSLSIPLLYALAYLLVLASESLHNSCVYMRAGRTINTAPISFSWRNNPLSGATSYRARHEAEKGSSTCFATEFYILLDERERASERTREGERKCARLLTPWSNKNENITRVCVISGLQYDRLALFRKIFVLLFVSGKRHRPNFDGLRNIMGDLLAFLRLRFKFLVSLSRQRTQNTK